MQTQTIRWGRGGGGARWVGLLAIVATGWPAVARGQDGPAPGSEVIKRATERAAAVARKAAAVAPNHPEVGLAAVLTAMLPRWAAGGMVEKAHLEALAADHRIQGEQAAALVVLLRHFKKGLPSFAADQFAVMAERHEFDRSYRDLLATVPHIPRTLFTTGLPHFDQLKQGPAGDCYLFSGAGWMARFHPHRIADMILPLPGNRYEVRFASGETATVAAPTDTEILFNELTTTMSDGLWMAVLEKAVGTIEGRQGGAKAAIADPSLRVNLGGSAKTDVHRWTGHAVDAFELKKHDQVVRARHALEEMERRHLMAQAVVEAPGPLPRNHAYAVLGYDPGTQLVTIWNPWGDDFTPKGPAGIEHGWPRHHGVFTIPFVDFGRVFAWLDVEHP